MNGWIIRNNNTFDWTLRWNKWMFNLLMVGHGEEYNKDNKNNKNKRISIRRP